jgi:Carboxypeptidase regulatory-like domain
MQSTSYPNTIRGTVLKANTAIEQPLRNARMELTGSSGTGVARTDGNGQFAFSNLPPGEYRLTVTCDGFVRQEFPKRIVVGRGQQVANIAFRMEAAPTAEGRVLDVYGLPIPNIMVEALRRIYDVRGKPRLARAATALTDDLGLYRIFWLDAGEYFFYASSPLPDEKEEEPVRVVAPTYYAGVTAPEDAKPVRLDIAREVRVDFRLRLDAALWGVNGQTMNGITGRPMGATITLAPPAEDPSLSRYRGQSSVTGPYSGQFSIGKVTPGTYIVAAKSGSGDQELSAFERIVLHPLLVTPERGYSVTLKLSRPLALNGRFFLESREVVDLHEGSVGLIPVDPDLPSPRSVLAKADGQFVLNGVMPGNYVLDVSSLPQDLYVKAARFGADDILEKPLALEVKEPTNPLQILLGSDGGRLQVAAYDNNGARNGSAQFVLVPDAARRPRRDQYRIAASSDEGLALIRGIPPGSYKLFAWEQLEPNAYLNSDYMLLYESFGVPVNIKPGENPLVGTRLIPKE